MRIALIVVLALTAGGCAKKAKAPAAPANTMESSPAGSGSGAPGGGAMGDEGGKGGTETKGDPCDGGESKAK